MADNEFNVTNINQATTATNNLNDALTGAAQTYEKYIRQSNKMMTPFLSGLDKVKKKMDQIADGVDEYDNILKRTEKGVKSLGNAFALAIFANNKQAMIHLNTMQRHSDQILLLAKQTVELSNELDSLSGKFKKNVIEIQRLQVDVDKLGVSEERLRQIYKDLEGMEKGSKQREEYIALLNKEEQATLKLIETQHGLREENKKIYVETQKTLDLLQEKKKAELDAINRKKEEGRATKMLDIEFRKMQGGLSGISATLEGIAASKYFDQMDKLLSGATIVAGLTLMASAWKDVGEQAEKVNQIALSLGDTSESSFGRMIQSATEASVLYKGLEDASNRLGYSMDELNGIANKFMLGTKMDREGRLGAEAVRDMTQETARFAKVAGIDTAEAAELMDRRIKRFGMTSGEAIKSMREMRVTLLQMTAGMKGNMVDLGNMVKIIEEASEASQSYIVDTRLMTQALRGAVTQAQNLGMAQKQAQDVAKGLGKVLSQTPDYIKIPAGQALLQKLMGSPEEAEKLLSKLDAGTRKQVEAIMKGVKNKTIGEYSAVQSLMGLIGQTEAGIDAQLEHLTNIVGESGEAAAIVKDAFQIENYATAQAITTMIKEAQKVRETFKDERLSFGASIAKDATLFNEAIDKAGNDREKAVKALQEKGLSPKQAEEYYDKYKKGEAAVAEIQDQLNKKMYKNLEEKRKLEDDLAKTTLKNTKDQLVGAQDAMEPTKKIMREIEAARAKRGEQKIYWDVTAQLDKKALEDANIKSADDLANVLGMNYDDNAEFLESAMKDGSRKTIAELQAQKVASSKMAKEAQEQLEDISRYMSDPIKAASAALKYIGNKIGLFTPWGKFLSGVALAAAGIWALWRGPRKIIEGGTYAALVKWGGHPDSPTKKTGTETTTGTPGFKVSKLDKFAMLAVAADGLFRVMDEATAKYDENGERIESAARKWTRTALDWTATILGVAASFSHLIPLLISAGPAIGSMVAAAAPWIAALAILAASTYAVIKAFNAYEEWQQDKKEVEEKEKQTKELENKTKEKFKATYGLDEEAYKKYEKLAEEQHMGMARFLEKYAERQIPMKSRPIAPPEADITRIMPMTQANLMDLDSTTAQNFGTMGATNQSTLKGNGRFSGDQRKFYIEVENMGPVLDERSQIKKNLTRK